MMTQRPRQPLLLQSIVYALAALSIVILIVSFWPGEQPPVVIVEYGSTVIDGEERTFRLALPPDHATSNRQLPVVFALHGALDTVDQMAQWSGLDEYAADSRAIVCYLQGRHLNWPPYIPPGNPTAADPDYKFFDQALTQICEQYAIDRQRVYLVGVSQGGAMTCLLATARDECFAAVVKCCGWLPKPLNERVDTTNKFPMLFIVGANDQQVGVHNVQAAYDTFKAADHPSTFHLVDDYGHGWPDELGINETVWNFLKEHSLLPASKAAGL